MITLGSVAVFLRGDQTQLNRDLRNARGNAGAEGGRAGESWGSRFGESARRSLEYAVGSLISAASQRIAGALTGAISTAFEATASYERLGKSFESLIARETMLAGSGEQVVDSTGKQVEGLLSMKEALAQSGPAAQDLLKWLTKLTIQSPFGEQDVQAALKTALSYGFVTQAANEVTLARRKGIELADDEIVTAQRLTSALMDAAAGTGAESEAMKRASLALGQTRAKGKLSGEELRQLMETGLISVDRLAIKMNTTAGDLLAKMQKGAVSGQDAVLAIVQALEEDFGGAAARQAVTWAGLTSTLEDIKRIGLREFFSTTFATIQPLVVSVVDKLSSPEFQAGLREMGETFGKKIVGGINLLQGLSALWEGGPVGNVKGRYLLKQVGLDKEQIDMAKAGVQGVRRVLDTARGTIGGLFNLWKGGAVGSVKGRYLLSQIGLDKEQIDQIRERVNAVRGVVETARNALGGVFNLLVGGDNAEKGRGMLERIGLDKGQIDQIQAVITGVKSALASIGPAAQGGLAWLVSTFGPALPNLQNMISRLGFNLSEIGRQVLPFLSEQGGKISGWLQANGPLITAFAQTVINTLSDEISKVLGAIQTGWPVVEPLLSGAIDLILSITEAVMNFVAGFEGKGWEALGRVPEILGDAFKKAWNELGKIVSSWFGEDWQEVQQRWADNWGMLAKIVERLPIWVENQFLQMRDALLAKVESIKEVAGLLVQGFIDGAAKNAQAVIDSITNPIEQAIGRAKKLLGIESPSKVFAKFGEQSVAGFAKGASGTAARAAEDGVVKALSQLSQTVGRETHTSQQTVTVSNQWNAQVTNPMAARWLWDQTQRARLASAHGVMG